MIIQGDALQVIPTLPAESIQCVVTSPPYYGLRDYGCAGQIGLEATPEKYVKKLVAVFREVRRVLRDDGTVWLNLGDSYSRDVLKGGSGPNGKHDFIPDYGNARKIMSESKGSSDGAVGRGDRAPVRCGGLKPKDLIGIPWRVAFALQADGWYLRSEIIWHKPNPMPESVTDRPTKSHEQIFLLTKNARYFYNADAVKEPLAKSSISRLSQPNIENQAGSDRVPGKTNGPMKAVGGPRISDARKELRSDVESRHRSSIPGGQSLEANPGETRNLRSVWTITTKPFKEAHFATFPPEIPEICIKAGSHPGDTILDPFSGAGTTGLVAERLNRKYVGIELNQSYVDMSEKRIAKEMDWLSLGGPYCTR